jgi:hypothetical protein
MEDLFNFFKNLSTAPDLPTREEEHLNHEPLNNVNFEQLNEATKNGNWTEVFGI